MTLEKVVDKIINPHDWTMRFDDEVNEFPNPTTANVAEIYTDWYGDCDMCPENGEIIFGITLQNDNTGECYLISTARDFDFESLMRTIERRLQTVNYGEVIKY